MEIPALFIWFPPSYILTTDVKSSVKSRKYTLVQWVFVVPLQHFSAKIKCSSMPCYYMHQHRSEDRELAHHPKVFLIPSPSLTIPTSWQSLISFPSLLSFQEYFTNGIICDLLRTTFHSAVRLNQVVLCISSCSVAQSCLILCDPMDCRMPGFPVLHHLSEFVKTHIHWVSDAIQATRPLSSPSPPALNLSQHQGLFQ